MVRLTRKGNALPCTIALPLLQQLIATRNRLFSGEVPPSLHRDKWLNGVALRRKLVFHITSNWIGYDRGDSFLFDFELNRIQFGLKSKENMSPRSYPIQFERKWNTSFLSVSIQFWRSVTLDFFRNWQQPKWRLAGLVKPRWLFHFISF